jgi:hypothetical protein
MAERTAAGSQVITQYSFALTLTPTLTRYSHTATLSGGGTVERISPQILANLVNGESYDFIVDIAIPQLELGAFATSPILTTGAAATRLADVASITGTAFSSFYNQSEGTIVVSGQRYGAVNFAAMCSISNNISAESLVIGHGSAANPLRFDVADGGVSQASIVLVASPALNVQYKVAASYKVNDFAASVNGASALTDTAGALPTPDRLYVGGNPSGALSYSGHIQSLTYYAKRLPNATLQSLTV